MAVILTCITIEVCKGNLGTDYDSAWYGFRSQYVLAPESGIYDKNILMCCVYNYPKGIEVLSLVFSGLSSYGYFNALNLVFAVLTLHAAYEMGKMVAKEQHALLMVAFIALTPSIMNMSLTAKSDLSTIYMQIVGLMFAIYAMKSKQGDYLVASLGVLILTLGFKPSSIVFTTIVVGIIILFAICLRIRPRLNDLSMFILPVAAVSCLFIRTAIITGYPITSIVTSVFKSLGFYPLYPYTLSSVRTTSLRTLLTTNLFWERLRRLIKLFFYPNSSDIYTLEMTWWGPMFSVLWIIALASILVFPVKTWKRVKNSNVECFVTVSFLVISAASGGCMLLLETPDGNYFMLMQVVTYLFIATKLATLEKNLAKKYVPPAVLLGLCNLLLCLTISAAWMVGFTPIDLKNYGYYNHHSKYWLVLFLAVVVSASSQMLLKQGASKKYDSVVREYLNPWVISGYALMILSTLCIIYAYRGVAYKNGAIIESLGYILIMLLSRLLFQEKITKKKLAGNLIILMGVLVFYL